MVIWMSNQIALPMRHSECNTALHFLDDNDPRAYSIRLPERANVDVVNFIRKDFDELRPAFASNIFFTDPSLQRVFEKGDWWEKIGAPPGTGKVSGTWVAPIGGGCMQTSFFDLAYIRTPSGLFGYRGTLIILMSEPGVAHPELCVFFHHGKRTIVTRSSFVLMPFSLTDAVIALIQLAHYVRHMPAKEETRVRDGA